MGRTHLDPFHIAIYINPASSLSLKKNTLQFLRNKHLQVHYFFSASFYWMIIAMNVTHLPWPKFFSLL